MVDGDRIVTLVQSMQRERDDAIKEKSELQVQVWQLQEELRKQKKKQKDGNKNKKTNWSFYFCVLISSFSKYR